MKYLTLFACLMPLCCLCQTFNSVRRQGTANAVTPIIQRADTAPVGDTAATPSGFPDNPARPVGTDNRALTAKPLFSLPLDSMRTTSGYGMRIHPVHGKRAFHGGVDLAASADTVRCILDGTVHQSGYHGYLGYFVKIWHGGCLSVYAHLSRYFVLVGETVASGQPIGITGSTGRVTGEHLHFAVHISGKHVNPMAFLKRLKAINEHFKTGNIMEQSRQSAFGKLAGIAEPEKEIELTQEEAHYLQTETWDSEDIMEERGHDGDR